MDKGVKYVIPLARWPAGACEMAGRGLRDGRQGLARWPDPALQNLDLDKPTRTHHAT